MPHTKDVVFFQAGGMALALYGRSDLAKDAQISPEGQARWAIVIPGSPAKKEALSAWSSEVSFEATFRTLQWEPIFEWIEGAGGANRRLKDNEKPPRSGG